MIGRTWIRTVSSLFQTGTVIKRSISKQALVRGPAEPPLLEQTVGEHFASTVSKYGDRLAVSSKHQRENLTYETLDQKSNVLARGLEARGVKKGCRVAVSLGNNVEFATITYALFKLGAILVPLNPSFSILQLTSALNHLSATHLITGVETNLPGKPPKSNLPIFSHLVPDLHKAKLESESVPSLKSIIVVNNTGGLRNVDRFKATTEYGDVMEGESGAPLADRELHKDTIATLQYTSGTTSMPKAACLTHRSILNNGKSIGDRMLLTPKDVVPFGGGWPCFGSILGFMATATHGSCIVFPAEAFSARATLLAVQESRATALYGVPTMFLTELNLISAEPDFFQNSNARDKLSAGPSTLDRDEAVASLKSDPLGFSSLRTGIAAGSQIPSELMRKLHKTLNLTELTICYGMTETSPVSAMTTTDDPIEKRLNSVGRLLPHVSAKIIDPYDGSRVLAIGERGELVVSGYLVMQGYWREKEKTDEVLVKGEDGNMWMHTGDEAFIDSDGYVTITGRLKDIIIRGGENIHPLDIENCLLSHPEFVEISAYGVPDERYGEVCAVSIVPKKQAQDIARNILEEDVKSWVRQKLPSHFVPKHVFLVDNLPKTPSGKVQRFKLQEEAIKILGIPKT